VSRRIAASTATAAGSSIRSGSPCRTGERRASSLPACGSRLLTRLPRRLSPRQRACGDRCQMLSCGLTLVLGDGIGWFVPSGRPRARPHARRRARAG
jgi:hypothetical protein